MTMTGIDGYRTVGYVQFTNDDAWNAAQANARVQSAVAALKKVVTRYDVFEAPPGGGQSTKSIAGPPSPGGTAAPISDVYRLGDGVAANEAIALNGHTNADVGGLMRRHQGSQPNDVHGFRTFIVHGALDKSRNINMIHYDNLRDSFVAGLNFGVQPIINAGGDLTNQDGWNPDGIASINVWTYEITDIYPTS